MQEYFKAALAFSAAALISFALSLRGLALGDTSIDSARCSVTAGRDASNNTLTCNFGLTPEQLREVTRAAVEGATTPLMADRKHQKTNARIKCPEGEARFERPRTSGHALRKVCNPRLDIAKNITEMLALLPETRTTRGPPARISPASLCAVITSGSNYGTYTRGLARASWAFRETQK